MRKIYLLITTALLLIGSSTLWAGNQAKVGNTEYATIGDAMNVWTSSGGTLQLLEDCVLSNSGCFILAADGTIDLNGHILTWNNTLTTGLASQCNLSFADPVTLTVEDESGNGELAFNNACTETSPLAIIYADGASFVLNGGKISASAVKGNSNYNQIVYAKNCTITGGSTEVNGKMTLALYLAPSGIANISGGAINGTVYIDASASANISGGTINGALSKASTATITISGGKFKSCPNYTYLTEGKLFEKRADSYFYCVDATPANTVATVNGKPFSVLNDALSYSTVSYPAVLSKSFTIDNALSQRSFYLDLNTFTLTYSGADNADALVRQTASEKMYFLGVGTIVCNSVGFADIVGAGGTATHKLSIGKDVNVVIANPDSDDYAISIMPRYNGNNAYGTTVDIYGTIQAANVLYIHGTVQETDASNPNRIPVINIYDGATITGSTTCIYAGGYGKWNIGAATLTAGSPIHAKAGIFNINGATINATRDTYSPITYNGSGANPTGNAIAIESNHGYAGNVVLNIRDGATITSNAGHAIEEAIVCKGSVCKDETQQIELTVVDGEGDDKVNAFSGALGTMNFSESFAQALRDGSIQGKAAGDYTWVVNGIVSGKYTAMPEVVADGYEVVVTSDAQFPYTVQRITEPIIPQESTEYITENTTSATVRTVGTTVDDKFAVIVKSGVTYEIEGLVVGNNAETEAKLVVEPGATLIVGASGIITHKAGNLILRADKEHGTAKLIFRDANSANTNPLATVELYLRARTIDAEAKTQLWQHYGLPVSYDEGLTSVEKNFGVNYNNWIVGKGWKYVTGDDMLSQGAWAGHNITTNTSVEGSIIRFKGQLIGRDNKELDFVPGYSCFTNSYTAPLSLRSLRDKLNASGVADPTIWIYDVSYAPTFRFVNNSFKDAEFLDKGIATMQAYFIPSEANGHSLTIDYDNDVIGFSNGSVKDAEVSEYNGGTIVLSDGFNESEVIITEGDDFSDAFDRGWDANLMEGLIPAIYVADGSAKYASFATNAIEGKKINIVTNNATEYSLSFKYLEGKAFKLKDLASGAEVEVSAESVYRFTAAANSTIERFELMEGSVAANEADADVVKIWVANKALNVAGAAEGDAIEIINLAGVKILSAVATGEAVQTISLNGIASGAYIVKAGAATVKVIK